jgi:Flp pilus assembly protein TadD
LIHLGDARAAEQVLPASLPSAPGVLARLLTAIEAAHPEPPQPPEPLPEVADRGSRRSVRRGLVQLRAERWPEAYQAFRRAENASVADPTVGFGLGLSLYYLGHSEESQARLLAVLDQLGEPFHSDALAALGKADLDLGHLDSAVVRLRRAIGRGARFPDNYYALGLALLRRGRPDLARKAFQNCVSPPFVRQRFQQLAGK